MGRRRGERVFASWRDGVRSFLWFLISPRCDYVRARGTGLDDVDRWIGGCDHRLRRGLHDYLRALKALRCGGFIPVEQRRRLVKRERGLIRKYISSTDLVS